MSPHEAAFPSSYYVLYVSHVEVSLEKFYLSLGKKYHPGAQEVGEKNPFAIPWGTGQGYILVEPQHAVCTAGPWNPSRKRERVGLGGIPGDWRGEVNKLREIATWERGPHV